MGAVYWITGFSGGRKDQVLYSDYVAGKEKGLAKPQVGMEAFVNPDLVLENDGAFSPKEQADIIYGRFIG